MASYYLSDERTDELYAHMHNLCGVMFASIPNFKDFYSEDIENGIACIRILNEIICDFDALLEEERFASIEKIKTVGATYMAASGLNPKYQVSELMAVDLFMGPHPDNSIILSALSTVGARGHGRGQCV